MSNLRRTRRDTHPKHLGRFLTGILLAVILCVHLMAQDSAVTGRVEFVDSHGTRLSVTPTHEMTLVWLTAVGPTGDRAGVPSGNFPAQPKLVQRNKSFEPHVLVVPVGASVEFPNRDPFFHNVFSLFDGKRFDLGLYEAGGTRLVHFDRPGISYIFCNIHPQMSAVVIALDTPYFAFADAAGNLTLPNVPAGRYRLRVWSERAITESSQIASREVILSAESHSLGLVRLATGTPTPPHKNKYGREYEEPTPANPVYH